MDENFPKPASEILTSQGHEVLNIRSPKFEGSNDTRIFELAQAKEAIFLTTDKDFVHTIPFLHQEHHGIIVVTLRQPNRKSIIEKLLFALDHIDFGKYKIKSIASKGQ